MTPRTIAVLAYDDAQAMDVAGVSEVFAVASEWEGGGLYDVRVVSVDGADVTSSYIGMRLGVTGALRDLGEIDTLVVAGSAKVREAMQRPELLAAIRDGAARARRVVSVCTGAFLLGAVGLLDGRRATTHWLMLDELQERFPRARVEGDPIFEIDGPVATSAGVTAGLDLSLALVEADHGPGLARKTAQYLVVFMQRPGGQAQFSLRMQAEPDVRAPLRTLLDEIAADPAGDHRLGALSRRAGFSERHLARVFMRELGTTPARYVEQVRLEAARALLESSDAPLAVIAQRSGLSSAETLRRTFAREVGVTPHAYRQRFRTTGALRAS